MFDKMFSIFVDHYWDDSIPLVGVLAILLILLLRPLFKMISVLAGLSNGSVFANIFLRDRTTKWLDQAELLEAQEFNYIAGCYSSMAKDLEIKKIAKRASGLYVPPFVIRMLQFVLVTISGLVVLQAVVQMLDQSLEMLPNKNGFEYESLQIVYSLSSDLISWLMGAALLLYFGYFLAMMISDSASLRGCLTKIRIFVTTNISSEYSSGGKFCLDRGRFARVADGDSPYIILYTDGREMPDSFLNIPGVYEVSMTDFPRSPEIVSALRNSIVFTCSWDSMDGYNLMVKLRNANVEAYYVGLLSDAWQLYFREFFSMQARYREGLSEARPLELSVRNKKRPEWLLDFERREH